MSEARNLDHATIQSASLLDLTHPDADIRARARFDRIRCANCWKTPLPRPIARRLSRAIALYNTYGFGYALGMNYRNSEGRRKMLWPQDLDESALNGRTTNGCRIAGTERKKA